MDDFLFSRFLDREVDDILLLFLDKDLDDTLLRPSLDGEVDDILLLFLDGVLDDILLRPSLDGDMDDILLLLSQDGDVDDIILLSLSGDDVVHRLPSQRSSGESFRRLRRSNDDHERQLRRKVQYRPARRPKMGRHR